MQKENIIINSIQKIFQLTEYVALPTRKRLISIDVNFDCGLIKDATIRIPTDEPMIEEEIKDKIIEVLE